MKWFSEKILLFGMAIVALTIGILISLSWNESENLKRTTQDVIHIKDIMLQTGKIISLILDNETNVRAFALIGDEKFSDQVKASDTSVDNEFKVLKSLAGSNPLEKNNLDSLAKYIDKKTEFSYNIIAYRRTGGQQAALKYILTGAGIAYTAKIKEIINQMRTVESDLLVQHNMQYSKGETIKDRYYYILIFFVFTLVVVLLFALNRQFSMQKRIKKELESEVKSRTEELNHIFERIADGFFALNNNWQFTYVNKKAADLVNVDSKKILHKNIWKELPLLTNQPLAKTFYKVREEQRYMLMEEYYEPLKKWFAFHVYPSPEGLSVLFTDITEKKNVENALKESEEKFHNFFENTPVGIIIRGMDGATIDFNNTLCNLLGYPRKELIQKPWTEVSHPDDIQLTSYWMQKLKDGTCDSARFEKKFFHKKGNVIWVDLSMFLYLDSEGKPLYIITSILDITDRKKAESELKASEEKYRTLVLEASDGIILQDIDGKLIDANERASAITGYSIEELRKMSVSDLITKEELEKNPYKLEEIKKGDRVHVERVIKRKDNTLIDVSTNARLLNNGNVIAIMRDVTQRKLSEKALKESEEKFSKVFHNSPEIIFLLSLDTLKIVDVNESVFKIAGYKREELIGKSAAEFSLWANIEERNKNLELLKKFSSVQHFEARFKKKSGEIFSALVSSEVIQLGESKYFISIVNDITERKKAEEELKQSREDYKSLFDKHRAVKLLIDPETGNIFDANDAAAEYYGWTREELRKMKVHDINGASSAEVQQKLREAEALGNFHFEFKHKKADGQIRDVEIYGSVTTISGRKYLHSIIFDITDKKKSEEALRQSEKNLKRGELTAKFGYWEIKSDEKSVYLSEGAQKIFGIDKSVLLYDEMKSFRLPEYHVPMNEAFRAVVEENKPYNIEYKMKRPCDGAIVGIHSVGEYDPKTRTLFGIVQDITERKKAEEALKQSEKDLKRGELAAKFGYWKLKLDEKLFYSSEGSRKIFGTDKIIASLEEVKNFALPDYHALMDEALRATVKENKAYNIEYKIKRANDGTIADIHSVGEYNPETRTLFGVVQDITERKKAEELLKKSENRYRHLIESANEGIMVAQGPYLKFVNPKILQQSGYTEKEILTMPFIEFIHPDFRGLILDNYRKRMMDMPVEPNTQIKIITKDESIIWVQLNGVKIEWEGKPALMNFITDISERKKAEETLKESEEKWRSLTENSPDHIMMLDTEGKILFINHTVPDLAKEQVIGKMLYDFMPERSAKEVKDCFNRILESGKQDRYNTDYINKDGVINYFESSANPIMKENFIIGFMISSRDITERIEAEEKIKFQNSLLNKMGNLSKVGAWEIDVPSLKQNWSEETYKIHDVDKETYDPNINEEVSRFVAKDEPVIKKAIEDAIRYGKPYDLELDMVTPKGNHKIVHTIAGVEIEDGKTKKVYGAVMDITERKKAEEQYRIILNTTIDGFYLTDLEGNILDTNDSYCSMIGYSREELLKMGIKDVEAIDTEEEIKKNIQHIMNTGPVYFETQHKRKDGRIIDIEASCSFLEEDKTRLFVFMRDITDRKKHEEKIRQLSEAVEQSPATIVITDINGNIQYANPMFTATTGYNIAEAIGQNPHILKSGFTSDEEYKKLWETIGSGKKWSGEFYNRKKNGEFYWESATISPIVDEHGKTINYLAVKSDISDRKKAEETVRLSESRLKEAQQMARIGNWDWDSVNDKIWWSEEYYKISGFDPNKPPPNYDEHLKAYTQESQARLDAAVKHTMETGESYEVDLEYADPDKTTKWITARAEVKRDLAGKVIGLKGTAQDITEKKKIEDAMHEAYAYTRRLIEASIDPLVTIGQDGKITDVNTSTELATGYKREELIGTDFSDYFTEPEKAKAGYQQVFTKGKVFDYPLEIRNRNGHITPVLYNATIYEDNKGNVAGVFAAARDVTENKRLEKEREQYFKFFNISSDLMVIADPNGCFKKINPAGLALLGYSEAELLAKPFVDFVHPDDRQQTLDEMAHQIKTGSSMNFENRYMCKGDTTRLLSWRANYVAAEGTTYATARDITEAKQAENIIQNANRYNRSLIEASIDPLVTIGEDGKITDVNTSTEQVTGYKREELIGTDFSDYFTEPEKAKAGYQQVFTKGKVYDYPLEIRNRNGHITPVLYNATIYKDSKGNVAGVFAAAHDITVRKKVEEALKKSEERFRHLITELNTGVLLHGPKGEVLMSNQRALDLIALSEEQLLGKAPFDPDWNVIHEDGSVYQDEEHAVPVAIKTKKTIRNVMGFYNPMKKERLWVLVTAAPEVDESGTVRQLICTFTDITERKKAEEKIKASEMRYRRLFESAKDGILILNADSGEIIDVNPFLMEMLGYSRSQFIGKQLWEIGLFKDIIANKDAFLRLQEEGYIRYENLPLKTKEGRPAWVEFVSNVYNVNGTKVIQCNIRNITDRVQAEEIIKASELRYRSLIEQASDAIFVSDETGRYVDVNTSTCKMLGYTREEFLKFTVMDIVFKEDLEKNPVHFPEMRAGKKVHYERRLKRKDGTAVEVEITGQRISDGRNLIFVRDITERKKAEQELRDSEEKFSSAFHATPNLMAITRISDSTIIEVNEGYSKLLGYSRAESIGKTTNELSIWANESDRITFVDALKQFGQINNFETTLRRKDGTLITVIDSARTIKLRDEKCILSIVNDITERKRAEEALMESEMKYRGLVENSPDAIVIYIEGKIVFANKATVNLIGASGKEELIGKSVIQFVHPDYKKVVIERMKKVAKEGTAVPLLDEKFIRFDGSEVDVEVQSMPILYQGKNAVQMIVRDITERKLALDALNRSEKRFKTLFEKASDGILIMSSDGKIINVNESFAKMHGYEVNEMVQMNLRILETPEMMKILPEMFGRVLSGETIHFETEHYHKDGRVISIDVSSCLIQVGNESYIQAFHTDITERKKAEVELRNTARQLRQLTNHLQTIREEERVRIGREIHDELGQQLTAIKMDAAWIDHKTPEKETAIKGKLKNIITLLDISNLSVRKILSELKPVIFDDRDLPEAMEWQNRQFTERTGIPVEFDVQNIDFDLPESISTCIFRVYQESLTNIAKYAHANKIVSSLSFEEDNIYLTVEDDGMGFVPESLVHKKTFGLLGMKERVLSLNGKFKVISALGKGTKIKVSIPLEKKETNEKLF